MWVRMASVYEYLYMIQWTTNQQNILLARYEEQEKILIHYILFKRNIRLLAALLIIVR